MKTYRVRWEIDIEADSPEEAALRALIVQRNRDQANAATVFDVTEGIPDAKLPVGIPHAFFVDLAGMGWTRVDLGETTAEQAEDRILCMKSVCGRCSTAPATRFVMNEYRCDRCLAIDDAEDREDLRRHGVEHHKGN